MCVCVRHAFSDGRSVSQHNTGAHAGPSLIPNVAVHIHPKCLRTLKPTAYPKVKSVVLPHRLPMVQPSSQLCDHGSRKPANLATDLYKAPSQNRKAMLTPAMAAMFTDSPSASSHRLPPAASMSISITPSIQQGFGFCIYGVGCSSPSSVVWRCEAVQAFRVDVIRVQVMIAVYITASYLMP